MADAEPPPAPSDIPPDAPAVVVDLLELPAGIITGRAPSPGEQSSDQPSATPAPDAAATAAGATEACRCPGCPLAVNPTDPPGSPPAVVVVAPSTAKSGPIPAPLLLLPALISVNDGVGPPPPTPVAPTSPTKIAAPAAVGGAAPPTEPVKKKKKMVLMTKKQRARKRALREKKRLKKEAEEKARLKEEARLAEIRAQEEEEERLRLEAEEEEEERLRLEWEAEEEERLRLEELAAAEAAALAASLAEADDTETEAAVVDKDSSPERFMDSAKDLGKWGKLKTGTQQGVVRGRYDRTKKQLLTEHERDREWQRRREAARPPNIDVHLKDVAIKQGGTVRLSCSVTGPNLMIRWYRDGDLIDRNNTKYKQMAGDGILSLEIVRAVPNDSGRYRCRLVNDNGDVASSSSVTVYAGVKTKPVPPMFTMTRDYYRLHEDILTIEVHCTGSPRPKITWVRSVVELETTHKYAPVEEAHGVYKLEIYKPTQKDSGEYTIRAKNSVATIEQRYDVHFIGKPLNFHLSGVQSAHSGYLKEKEQAALAAVDDALYCREQYELIKSGGYVPPYRRPRQPKLQPSRLRFVNHLRDRVGIAGQKVRFTCLVVGSDPDIHWLKDGKPMVYDGLHVNGQTFEGLSSLEIDRLTLEMTGEYTCVARSEGCEEVSTRCFMRVFEARHEGDKEEPIFLLSIRDVFHSKENDLVIDCKLGGNPTPVIQWFKDGDPVDLNERIQQVESADGQSALIINKPTPADSGKYACIATNKLGCVQQEHDVVFVPPVVPPTGRREHKVHKPKGKDIGATDETTEPDESSAEAKPAASGQRHVTIKEDKGESGRGTKTEQDEAPPPEGGRKLSVNEEPVDYVRRHVVPTMGEIRKASRSKLSFSTHLTNRVVAEGQRVKLSCAVLGPEAMARWTKDDEAIKFSSKYKNASGDGLMGIEVVDCRPEDSGVYELTIRNQVSCLTSVCTLEVYSLPKRKAQYLKPTFARNLKHVYHVDINQIVLDTRVRGDPKPTVEWSYNFMPIDRDMPKYRQRTYPDGTCELVILYPHPIDGGKYKCLASNRAGDASVVHNVVFEGREEYIAQNRVRMYLSDKKRVERAKIEIRGGVPIPKDVEPVVLDLEPSEDVPAAEAEAGAAAGQEEGAEGEADGAAEAAAAPADGVPTARATRGADDKAADKLGGIQGIHFKTFLSDRVVAVGSKVKLTGYIEGADSLIRWFKNDVKVPSTPKCRLSNLNGVVTLELRSAKVEDSGVYTCTAKNDFGEVSSSANLQVYHQPETSEDCAPIFIKSLTSSYNSKISEITLRCNLRAIPTPYIFWTKDGMPIQGNAKYKITALEDGTCELLVSFTDWKDMGKYVCKAENRLGRSQVQHIVDVKLKEVSTTKLYDLPASTATGHKVTFREEDEEGRVADDGEGAEADDGKPAAAEPIYVRRHQPAVPLNPKDNLHFGTYLVNLTSVIGTAAKFTCYVSGPDPKFTWYKENPRDPDEPELIESCHKGRYKTECHNGVAVMYVKKVAADDAGQFRLVARNAAGEISCRATLTPYHKVETVGKPYFIKSIKDTYNTHDDELILECRVRGEPRPVVKWKVNDKSITQEINPRSKQTVADDGTCRLIIAEPNSSDNGIYKCVARNRMGLERIVHPVQFEGRDAHMLVKAYGNAHRNPQMPYILNHINDHTVSKGGVIGLIVELQQEATEVQWFHNNRKLLPWSSKVTALQEYNVYMLIVPDVQPEDAGTYMIRVINEFGRAESVGNVDVVPVMLENRQRSAQFQQRPPTEQLIATGDPFEFKVTMAGNPKPKLTLYKGLRDITRSERVIREQNEDHYRVSIENTDPSDSGTYWLVARNEHGTDRAYVTITVKLCKKRHHHKKKKPEQE